VYLDNTLYLPVKYSFYDDAAIELIERELALLLECYNQSYMNIYLPLLGAGFGGLSVITSLTLMAKVLTTDNFILVIKDEETIIRYKDSLRPAIGRTDYTS
jgi:hypothetical protein